MPSKREALPPSDAQLLSTTRLKFREIDAHRQMVIGTMEFVSRRVEGRSGCFDQPVRKTGPRSSFEGGTIPASMCRFFHSQGPMFLDSLYKIWVIVEHSADIVAIKGRGGVPGPHEPPSG